MKHEMVLTNYGMTKNCRWCWAPLEWESSWFWRFSLWVMPCPRRAI